MNKKILSRMIFGAALLLFAACTQDELTEQGDTLPEGMYPLEISSVTLEAEVSTQPWGEDGPQTRVSENNPDRNSSKWDGGEVITVQLGDNQTTTYRVVNTDGTLERTGDQLYWTKRTENVTAWYPANGEIKLDNQQDGKLAYVLQAVVPDASCDKSVTLDFSHQLAKIWVKLTGEKANNVEKVKIESYTSCTSTNGAVSTDGASVGEIAMYRVDNSHIYEANVVPGKAIERFRVNGGDWVKLSNPVTPEKGKIHEISIDVKKAPLQPGEDGKFTVNAGDDVLIKNYSGPASIVVNGSGNATITLDNVQLATESTAMEINSGATVTLNVKGMKNSLVSTNGSGIGAHENCSITIKGDGTDKSKLTVSSGKDRNVGIGFITNTGQGTFNYGNIEISGVTLSVGGGDSGAAIGTTGAVNSFQNRIVCGNITINNANVTANSKNAAACIGTSSWSVDHYLTWGVISIMNSTITAKSDGDVFANYAACIGMGAVQKGSVTIKKIEIENSKLNLTTDAEYKVGKGTVKGGTPTITEGIIVDEQNQGNNGWNPE